MKEYNVYFEEHCEDVFIEFLVGKIKCNNYEEAKAQAEKIFCDFVHLSKTGLTFSVDKKIVHYKNRDKSKYTIKVFVRPTDFPAPVNSKEIKKTIEGATDEELDAFFNKYMITEDDCKAVKWTLTETFEQMCKHNPNSKNSYFSFESLAYWVDEVSQLSEV